MTRWVRQLAIAADIELLNRFSELALGPSRLVPKLQPLCFVDDLPLNMPSLQSPRRASQCSSPSSVQNAGSLSLRAMTRLYPGPRIQPTK